MTTPTSALGMSHIQTEFGGSNPIALSEYYGVNANVAASGTIRMASFLGISAGPPVQVLAKFPTKAGLTSPQNAWCVFASTGGYTQVPTSDYTWLLSGAASSYQIRYIRTAGSETSLSGGLANNTWYALSTTRTMYLSVTLTGQVKDLTANVQISYVSNSTIISYASVTWQAERLK